MTVPTGFVDSVLLDLLADPVDGGALSVDGDALRGADGRVYPVVDGIPRFVPQGGAQEQTQTSFGFKWQRRSSYEEPAVRDKIGAWLRQRYGFDSAEAMRDWFGSRRRILDAGCGAGLAASTWIAPGWSSGAEWIGLDISTAIDVARERLTGIERTHFVQGDVTQPPFRRESFDAIFSEGVLHHTPSTAAAFHSLVSMLSPRGELMVYVYRRKAPLREFADDYVRRRVAPLGPEEGWEAVRPLTRLGQALAELHAEIEVPEDVPLLGIPAGRYDIQRLFYWHVAKLFWRDDFSFEANNHVNFDWYHPQYAHRHTEEEVRGWCAAAGLEIVRFDAQESGFTVRARRP